MVTGTSLYPMKLKDTPNRLVLVVLESQTPYFIEKSDPNVAAIATTLHQALDWNRGISVQTSTSEPHRIVAAQVDQPNESPKKYCPDRPEMTRTYWESQGNVEVPEADDVRWVSQVPDCKSYRVAFFGSPAFYWVHSEHPNKQKILEMAWKSINEDIPVRIFLIDKARAFIADLKPNAP